MLDTALFLRSRPWWEDTHNKVNDFLQTLRSDSNLVSNPDDGTEIKALIDRLRSDPDSMSVIDSNDSNTIAVPMEQGYCHSNAAQLLRSGQVKHMVKGFALSADNLWRHHSWGVRADGTIVETTEPRLIYVAANIYERRF